jgi:transcriptional regulator with XRE-family HTH domain
MNYAISIANKKERITYMADLQEIIGRVIRRERQDRQLTIKELGDKAGLSEIYVGEIERGQKYPSSKVLESLARALDLDIADLLELMAEEIRYERQPETVNAIGFTLPSTPGQPRRLVVKKIVNMLNEGDVESVANFSAFLLSKQQDIH